MKTKLCVAALGVLLLGAMSASALTCNWCDCSMSCTKACRNPDTWGPSTCGEWGGLCAGVPDCLYLASANPLMQELSGLDKSPICSEQAPALVLQPAVTTP